MKHTHKALLISAILVFFAIASVCAQPGITGQPKSNPPKNSEVQYVFGNIKDWRPDPMARITAPRGVKTSIVLNATDPIVGETDNYFRFVVVQKGTGAGRDFTVSVLLNDIAHMLLSSKEAYRDAKGFYFQFTPTEIGPLPKGKHKLMLVIDHGKSTLVRSAENQYSVPITVK